MWLWRNAVVLIVWGMAFSGCSSLTQLSINQNQPLAVPNKVGAPNLPMGLSVDAPENMPVAQSDLEMTLSSFSLGSRVVNYPLRIIMEQVFTEGIKSNFRLPKPGEIPPYKIAIAVLKSRLRTSRGNSQYDVEVLASLNDRYGEKLFARTLTASATSVCDGISVPNAVWQGAQSICEQVLGLISGDTRTLALLKKAEPVAVGNVYECDLQVLDLAGHRVIGVSGRVNSQTELRSMAEDLIRKLDQKWTRQATPKAAVLDFRTTGAEKNLQIGASFASFVEAAVEKQNMCQILDRKRLDLIMQEHDLRTSDIAADPTRLGAVKIPLDTVQFFITGQISVVGAD